MSRAVGYCLGSPVYTSFMDWAADNLDQLRRDLKNNCRRMRANPEWRARKRWAREHRIKVNI